jgi:acetyltransferase-like isoleucine patch superfamily enzyme
MTEKEKMLNGMVYSAVDIASLYYGKHISVGKRFFANFHFTVLDEAKVTIGDDCFIGPNVSIYTACHSTNPCRVIKEVVK